MIHHCKSSLCDADLRCSLYHCNNVNFAIRASVLCVQLCNKDYCGGKLQLFVTHNDAVQLWIMCADSYRNFLCVLYTITICKIKSDTSRILKTHHKLEGA